MFKLWLTEHGTGAKQTWLNEYWVPVRHGQCVLLYTHLVLVSKAPSII